jgi:2',3'-cyclic-nucleotide 2'-phosphodiesterase / phosphoenolpyruvate phosphatase
VRVLFIGDVFGKPGRMLVAEHLPQIRSQFDFVIVNGENSAGGFGLNRDAFNTLTRAGADCITLGNHAWDNKEVLQLVDDPRVIRPLNSSIQAPGRGYGVFTVGTERIAVVNLLGRVFMNAVDNPYDALEDVLETTDAPVFVDFHAEATSEKACLAYNFDGRIAALIGTHTHVATADTRFLPNGTLFQSDVGMTGPLHSSIGMSLEGSIYRLRTSLPMKTEVASGPCVFSAVAFTIEAGRVVQASRYRFVEGDLKGIVEGEIKHQEAVLI